MARGAWRALISTNSHATCDVSSNILCHRATASRKIFWIRYMGLLRRQQRSQHLISNIHSCRLIYSRVRNLIRRKSSNGSRQRLGTARLTFMALTKMQLANPGRQELLVLLVSVQTKEHSKRC